MRGKVLIVALGVVFAALVLPALAFAFDYPAKGRIPSAECTWCHSGSDYMYGPHGDYDTTTDDCNACHTIHEAPGTKRLLAADTVTDACSECHDGTGAKGVYGALTSLSLPVNAAHSIDQTNVVPGGDWTSGGSRVETFTGEDKLMSCDDCHSPHRNRTVDPFWGDRRRWMQTWDRTDHLLKQRPTGAETTVTVYGSDWCGACHRGRFSNSPVHNHPVDSHVSTTGAYFIYDNVALVKDATSLETTLGRMARSNFGYVMPYPRTPEQAGHAPICQQCHEDARNVGSPGAAVPYNVTKPYGQVATDNPYIQTFPHETTNAAFLLEEYDDLCLNCHPASSLP